MSDFRPFRDRPIEILSQMGFIARGKPWFDGLWTAKYAPRDKFELVPNSRGIIYLQLKQSVERQLKTRDLTNRGDIQ